MRPEGAATERLHGGNALMSLPSTGHQINVQSSELSIREKDGR